MADDDRCLDLDDVLSARQRISRHLAETPARSSWIETKAPLHLKLECWQPTGSFKVRGAVNAMAGLDGSARSRGVVTASAGNHGLGVAFAAQATGGAVETTVFVPETTPRAKRDKLGRFPVELRVEGATYEDSERRAKDFARERQSTFVHAFEDIATASGQGTIALEALESFPKLDSIVVPVGGGGMIAAIATVTKTLRPDVRVIAVQPAASPALRKSLERGEAIIEYPAEATLADGVAGGIGLIVFRHRDLIDDIVEVTEEEIERAMAELLRRDQVVAEGSGALAVAAVLSGRVTSRSGEPLLAIVSGGNVDADVLRRVLAPRP